MTSGPERQHQEPQNGNFPHLLDAYLGDIYHQGILGEINYADTPGEYNPRYIISLALEKKRSGLLEESYTALESMLDDVESDLTMQSLVWIHLADVSVKLINHSKKEEKKNWIEKAYHWLNNIQEAGRPMSNVSSRHTAILMGKTRFYHSFLANSVDEERLLLDLAYSDFSSLTYTNPTENPFHQSYRHNILHQIARRQVGIATDPTDKLMWLHRQYDEAKAVVSIQSEDRDLTIYKADFSHFAGLAAEKIADLEEEPAKKLEWLRIAQENFIRSVGINLKFLDENATTFEDNKFITHAATSYAAAGRIMLSIVALVEQPAEIYDARQAAYNFYNTSAILAYRNKDFIYAPFMHDQAANIAIDLANTSVDQEHVFVWFKNAFYARIRSAEIGIESKKLINAAFSLRLAGREAKKVAYSGEYIDRYTWMIRAYYAHVASGELFAGLNDLDNARKSVILAIHDAKVLTKLNIAEAEEWETRINILNDKLLSL